MICPAQSYLNTLYSNFETKFWNMEHIQDLSFSSFNDPVIVKQLKENNLENPGPYFAAVFCLKIYFVVEFIQFYGGSRILLSICSC